MEDRARIRLSRFMSLVLRHRPELLENGLDAEGWVDIEQLLAACHRNGQHVRHDDIEFVVAHCEKQRFAIRDGGALIRANQGHSTNVSLGYEPATPPMTLFHGTNASRLPAIQREGLRRMKRHHVHLSAEIDTARRVGSRRGDVRILVIQSGEMHNQDHTFYLSENGVWLTDHVPAAFLRELPE